MKTAYLSMRFRMGSWMEAGARVSCGIVRTTWTASMIDGWPDGRGVMLDGRSATLIT